MPIISILLVDDEEILLEASKLYLENLSEKFQIFPLNSAIKALEKLDSNAFDIIISDYQMPKMNGLEFLEKLRSVGNETPFIIFTGKGREEVAIQALNLGADYYLQKGGETRSQFRELVNLIEKLVEKKQIDVARKRLLEQQISINKLALTLGDTRDLNKIYKTVFQYIYAIMDADTFVVDFYNKEEKTISHGYTLIEGNVLDIMMFPPIPLGHRESEIQTKIIESGEVIYKSNFYKNNNDSKGTKKAVKSSKSDGVTKSAVYVPMKIAGEIIGILQIQSYRHDAYSKADIELLSGMANVAAVSIQNARLFSNQFQMTQNLIEEKNRTQKYLNLADALIITLDHNGKVIMINNKGCEILNRSEDEIIGKNWYEHFIPKKNRKEAFARFNDLINGKIKAITSVINPILRKSDEERIIRWKTDVRRDQQNKIIGILSSGIDITDEVKTQESLMIFQTRYQRLLENVDQGIIIFEEQKVVFLNDKTCEIYGRSMEELMKFSFLDVCAPEDRAQLEKLLKQERDEGELIEETSFWTITQNGERKFIQNRIYFAYENGNIVNRFMFVSDKTNEMLTNNALKMSEENYRTTLNSMGVPIHVADKDLRIILTNQSLIDWLKNLDINSNIIGKKIFDVFPFLPQRVKDEYKQTIETKQIVTSEDVSHLKSFNVMNETRKIPVIEDGEVVRIITIIRDITEQKEMEMQLRENEQNTRRLLDNLNDGIVLFNFQGKIIDTNKKSSEILGFSQEELETMAFNDFIDESDAQKFADFYKKIIETGNASFNLRLKTKDNLQFLSEINASLIELVGKHYIQAIFRDVSQRKQLEEEKEKRINDLMFLSQTAVNFVSLPINENIYEYIGLKIREIVGESIVITFSFDSENNMFSSQALIGARKKELLNIIDLNPIGVKIKVTKDVLDFIKNNPIGKFNESLNTISEGLFSKDQEKLIRSLYKIDNVFSVSFTHLGRLFGTVIIAPTDKEINDLPNRELLSAFANQTAVALLRRKAERDLHDSVEKYRILFSDSNDGIFIFNSKFEIIDFNQKAEELLGFKDDILREKKITDLLPKQNIERFLEKIMNLQDNKITKFEMDLSNQLDRTFTVEITANYIEVGQKQLIQIIFRDITQKKIVEEIRTRHINTMRFISYSAMEFVALPSEKNIFHFIAEKISELAENSIVVVSTYNNESDTFSASAIMGINRHLESLVNILGQSPNKISVKIDKKYINLQNIGKLKKLQCTIDELTKSSLSKKQGTILWKLMNLGEMYSLEFVEDGKLSGTVLIVVKKGKQLQNIELIEAFCNQASVALLRKLTEEELIESEERFRELVETMNDGFGMDDENGFITYINAKYREMLGYSQEEMLGKKAFEFLDEASQEAYLNENSERKNGFYRPYEINWRRKDGKIIPTIVSPKAILDAEDKFLGTYAVITDISERKAAETRLQNQQIELQKQRDELESFTSTIAHDLRGKMQIISLYNSIAKTEYSHKISESIEEMSAFIEDLLLLAKKGEILGDIVKVNLNDLIKNLKTKICTLSPELEIKISKLPTMKGDQVKLGQVFENLMMNVVKHAKASKLEIYQEKDKNCIQIIFKDNGKGISEKKKLEIIESWSTKRYSSFGMLIIVKIVQAHKGQILLESEEGKGTKIVLTFPK